MAVIIAGELNKNDIVEMSGVMKVMENDLHNIKSVEGLIEKMKENCNYDNNDKLSDYTIDLDEAIDIIKKYCEVDKDDRVSS